MRPLPQPEIRTKRHPASGEVMRTIGMRHEGTLRQHVRKWNQPEDLALYAILRQGG